MHIIVVGLSHKTTPVDLREQLYFPEAALEGALEKLAHYTEGGDRVILSTCNRVEIYGHVPHLTHGRTRLRQFLSDYHGLPLEVIAPSLYTHHGAAALRHLCRVLSSLDSLVVGEPQITAQVKAAFAIAKRVRTETRIGQQAASVSSAAVELAQKIFQDLDAKTVLIVGAGEMSELTARHLMSYGVTRLLVANRTLDRARELARRLQGQGIALADLPRHLPQADIVISSTGAPAPLIGPAEVQSALRQRKNRPMFFIDIAVPRDIDPAINGLDNVYLYDIDDLQHVVQENLKARQREAALGEAMIEREVEAVVRWLDEQEVVPAVIGLRRKAEAIRKQELAKLFAKHGAFSEGERDAIAAMASAITNKLLHAPIIRLKQDSRAKGGSGYLQALRELFSLDDVRA